MKNANKYGKITVSIGAILSFLSISIMNMSMFGKGGISSYNNGYGTFDFHIAFDSNTVYSVMKTMGQNGMGFYERYLFVDFFFIIGVFLIGVGAVLLIAPKVKALYFFPCSVLAFDIIEVLSLIAVIEYYPNVIKIAGCIWIFIVLKYINLFLSAVVILYSLYKSKHKSLSTTAK